MEVFVAFARHGLIGAIAARDDDNPGAGGDELAAETGEIGVDRERGAGLHGVGFAEAHGVDGELAAAIAMSAICGAALGDDAGAAEREDEVGALRIGVDGDVGFHRQRVLERNADTHAINVGGGGLA